MTLREIKNKFKLGDKFLSASGLLKSELTVVGRIRYGENGQGHVYCDSGLLYDNESGELAVNLTRKEA